MGTTPSTSNDSMTNRYGDTVAVGQRWLDDPARDVRRTLRVDSLGSVGSLGFAATCTVIKAHNQDTGEETEPGRVVSINLDRLHTTASGKGYRLES